MTATLSPLYNVMCSTGNLNILLKSVFTRSLCCGSFTKASIVSICKKLEFQTVSVNNLLPKRNLTTNVRLYGVTAAKKAVKEGLSKLQAEELTLKLTSEEREILLNALQEYQSKIVKDEYIVQSVIPPTTKELMGICFANSIPFIGFGFLDNFIMIIAGDYIDLTLGSYLCLSTMAAAALGNTFSDVMGIGSAYYVERLANYIGFQPPKLTPIQLDMPTSRQFGNLGRVLGVTVGCLLGMFPLLFIPKDEEKIKQRAEKLREAKIE